jgi:TonB family protein
MLRITLALLLVALTTSTSAQAQTSRPIETRSAMLLFETCPPFPSDQAAKANLDTLEIRFRVLASGELDATEVVHSSGDPAFDALAVDYLKSCKFSPAIVGGAASAGWGRFAPWQIERAREQRSRRPGTLSVQTCRPTALDYPVESRRLNEQGQARVRVTIDDKGQVLTVAVVQSSGFPRLDAATVSVLANCKTIRSWGLDGKPAGGTFEVTFDWRLE